MAVRKWAVAWCVAGALALVVPAVGAAQTKAKPSNATGQCKDGSYTTAKSKSGACSNHGGVDTWYADTKDAKTDSKTAAKETKTDTKAAAKDTKTDTKAAAKDTKTDTKAAAKESKAEGKETKSAIPTVARPADAPSDATAQCNDGTFSKAVHHQGACSNHKGVKSWFK